MQIVVTLSEEDYKVLITENDDKLPSMTARRHLYAQLREGTLLPKGHGRLKDIDKIINDGINKGFCSWYDEMRMADTVIEADMDGE